MKLALVALLSFFSITSIYSQDQGKKEQSIFEYKWLNKKLPIDTLSTYGGEKVILFTSGKSYVISFWYAHCPPCIAEIEWLNKLKEDYSDQNIEFIAISFDRQKDIDDVINSHPFDFKLCYLSDKITVSKQLTIGYPTNLFVNSEGVVLFQKSGGVVERGKAKRIYDLLANEIEKNQD